MTNYQAENLLIWPRYFTRQEHDMHVYTRPRAQTNWVPIDELYKCLALLAHGLLEIQAMNNVHMHHCQEISAGGGPFKQR